MQSEEIRQTYDEAASGYDAILWVLEKISGAGHLRQDLMQQARGAVLDVACGTGRNIPFFPPDCHMTGVDLSTAMLKKARKRAKALGRDVQFFQQDIERLDFPSGTFDTVVSSFALCTFPHPLEALQEMVRVCTSDGRLLLLEHGQSNRVLLSRLLNGFAPRFAKLTGCHCNREPLELVRKTGMNILAHRRSCFGILHVIEAQPGT